VNPIDDPDLPLPAWAFRQAERPDARTRIDARLPAVLRRLRDGELVARVKELYGYATDPRVPAKYKLVVLAGLVYLVNPFDVIPDAIPGVGFLDDAAVVLAILEAVRRIVDSIETSAKAVVSHAVSETEEAFARRGIQQIALSLWAVPLAACVGLVYAAARMALVPANVGGGFGDPFLVATLVVGATGLVTSAFLAQRVWQAYRSMLPDLRDPLASAIVASLGVREVVLLALPIVVLVLLLGVRIGLAARG